MNAAPAVTISVLVPGVPPIVQRTLAVPPELVVPDADETVPGGVPPPAAAKPTVWPATTLPNTSLTITVISTGVLTGAFEGGEPTTATEFAAPATTDTTRWDDGKPLMRYGLTGCEITVAVIVCTVVARLVPNVHEVNACPKLFVTASAGLTLPDPPAVAKVTTAPGTGDPLQSRP